MHVSNIYREGEILWVYNTDESSTAVVRLGWKGSASLGKSNYHITPWHREMWSDITALLQTEVFFCTWSWYTRGSGNFTFFLINKFIIIFSVVIGRSGLCFFQGMLDNHELPRFVSIGTPICVVYHLFLHYMLCDCEYMIDICHNRIHLQYLLSGTNSLWFQYCQM